MRQPTLIAAILLVTAGSAGCIVPEDMPALREELGYASVEEPDVVVHARASTLTPVVDETVTLTAETEGLPLSQVDVTWTVDGETREGEQIEVSFPDTGVREASVEVVGPEGATASDAVEIDVGPNEAPEADLVVENRGEILAGDAVSLLAGGSSDPDGDELTYEWRLDGETVDAGETLETQLAAGIHEVHLTVSDGHAEHSVSETFGVNFPVDEEVELSATQDVARFTVPVEEGLDEVDVTLTHTTRGGVDDANLTLTTPDGSTVAFANTEPETGASQATERLTVDGEGLDTSPHTLEIRLERGTEARGTIEGVLTYSPLPRAPG